MTERGLWPATPTSGGRALPGGISRSLSLLLGGVVLVVVLVGGASVALAVRIERNHAAVTREHRHIRQVEQVHLVFHELVFELHQAESTTVGERTTHALLLDEDLVRELDALAALHEGDGGAAADERELALLSDLRRLATEAQALARRLAATGAFTGQDIEWLDRAAHVVPREVNELTERHRAEIARRLESSQQSLRIIGLLYALFVLAGAGLVAVVSVAARRSVAVPLRRLAAAAGEIADGKLDARVRVRSWNEIGELSRAFNVMADRLGERERELAAATAALEARVRETQALYRIGTEISRLHQLDRIVQSVADRTRELLHADAVALCLFGPGRERLVARATSGVPDAFRPESTPAGCAPAPAEGIGAPGATPCAVIRPEYARAWLSAPLRLGDDDLGTLYACRREERAFGDGATELLAGLATQAVIAVERARLSEEVQSLAAVRERERIAREMHDGLAQALGVLHVKLQAALAHSGDAEAVAGSLREMIRIADDAYEDVRRSIFDLRTFVSRGLGLVPGLTEYLHEFSAQNGIAVELEVAGGTFDPLPAACEVQAVRIVQEALANVRKHAAATRAVVRLRRDGAWARVEVEDDGGGWDLQSDPDRTHFGLQTMRERAEAVGGRLDIDTAPGRGARVAALLPTGDA